MVPDYVQTVKFLKEFSKGPYLLTAIPVEKGHLKTELFDTTEGVEDWCKATNDGHGLYYSVAVPKAGAVGRVKLSKSDVAYLEWLWVDVDPPKGEELGKSRRAIYQRLSGPAPTGVPCPPHLIVDSGGGFQGLWRLSEPLQPSEVERYTRFLVDAYGGDTQSWNIDRLLRLPGTINYPDKKKLEMGRVTALSSYMSYGHDPVHPREFSQAAPRREEKGPPPEIDVSSRKVEYTPDNLPEMSDKWKSIVVDGEESFYFEDEGYPSRSEAVLGFVRYALEKGLDHQVIHDILLSPELRISAHVLEQKDVERYARRQITQCLKSIEKPKKEEKKKEKIDFLRSERGTILTDHLPNIQKAFEGLGLSFRMNELTNRALVSGYEEEEKELSDTIITGIRKKCAETFYARFNKHAVRDMALLLSEENGFHPIREYLSSIQGKFDRPRIDRWLIDYLGAPDTPYIRAIGAIVLIAAVRRVRKPGCKFDEMLILEGPQGTMKSTSLKILAGEEWFSDYCPLSARPQEFIEATDGKWLIEVSDLDFFRRAEVNNLKAVLSRTTDRARAAYGFFAEDRKRQFVLIGTTNETDYLKDTTGNRRFWPVKVGEIRLKELSRDRDALWAEAAEREAKGEDTYLPRALRPFAQKEQETRQKPDPWEDIMKEILGDLTGRIRSMECFKALEITPDKQNPKAFGRLKVVMEKLGWEYHQSPANRGYKKGDAVPELVFDDVMRQVREESMKEEF